MKKIILIIVVTLLTLGNIISIIRLESWNYHHEQDNKKSFKFDTLSARVVANSNVIMVGTEYQAEVFLSAFSTTTPITLETDSFKPNQSVSYKNGICLFQSIPDSEGTYEFKGKLKVKGPNGEYATFPFATEYKTFKPFAVIESADEFVLHRGQENKINVSVPGIALEDLYILVSNA